MSTCKDASGEAKVDTEVPVKRCQFCSWMRHLSKDCKSKGNRGSKTGDEEEPQNHKRGSQMLNSVVARWATWQ